MGNPRTEVVGSTGVFAGHTLAVLGLQSHRDWFWVPQARWTADRARPTSARDRSGPKCRVRTCQADASQAVIDWADAHDSSDLVINAPTAAEVRAGVALLPRGRRKRDVGLWMTYSRSTPGTHPDLTGARNALIGFR